MNTSRFFVDPSKRFACKYSAIDYRWVHLISLNFEDGFEFPTKKSPAWLDQQNSSDKFVKITKL